MKIYYAAFESIAPGQVLERILFKDDTFRFSTDKVAMELYIIGCEKMRDEARAGKRDPKHKKNKAIQSDAEEPIPLVFEVDLSINRRWP